MQRTATEPLTVRHTPLAVRIARSCQLYLLLPTIALIFTATPSWDHYLKQLDRLGLPTAMEIYQAAYDRFAAN